MDDYKLMVEAFNISLEKAEELSNFVREKIWETDNRAVIAKELLIENFSNNELAFVFYLFGCLEGYYDAEAGR